MSNSAPPEPGGLAANLPRHPLADEYEVPRIIVGSWQASEGHSSSRLDPEILFGAWSEMVDLGFTAFDTADIYTGVESLLGEFLRRRVAAGHRDKIRIHTKFVPDRDALATLDKAYVERIIDRSLSRLGVEHLDLVQFHWWDYETPGWIEAANWLGELLAAGKIRRLGVTNFDVPHLRELLETGVPFVTNSVQYSLLDRRPENGMIELCRDHGLRLLCYGTLAGGLLTNHYLGALSFENPLQDRSLDKYRLIVDDFGGWAKYQELLATLGAIAGKHSVDSGTVAIRWVLDQPTVAAAIVGVRSMAHVEANLEAFRLRLDDEDRALLADLLAGSGGRTGRIYEAERVVDGKHASLMHDDLNRGGNPPEPGETGD